MTTTETTETTIGRQAAEGPPTGRWYPGHPDYTPAPSPEEARQLSPDQLKALQVRWYLQALEHGDIHLARTLAAELGEIRRTGDNTTSSVYDRGDLHIELTDAGRLHGSDHPLAIDVGRQAVCRDGVGWELFVPGPWLEDLREAGREAELARERRDQERLAREAQQQRRDLLLEQHEPDAEPDGLDAPTGTYRERGR